MELQRLENELTVCKLAERADIGKIAGFLFLAQTDEEISLVCETQNVPENALEREDGWRAFRIRGILDFSLVGILAKISAVLADEGIGIFAISTFNTDYILVKRENFARALDVLKAAGYTIL